ncbi:MAG: 23S rRNA (adenine(2503)-C(2))-methyltransferase RlmN [Gammaproteobacteria bacterium]|nr:23S rRNA (adenine(2503)-C(2))-methyltransferase RlmN [Gammaproteobacteria bacterium]
MSTALRPNLLGLSPVKLTALLEGMGEKPFRARQLMRWIHRRGVLDFGAMTDIGKSFRERLTLETTLAPPELVSRYDAEDGCVKWIIRAASGSSVEMVYIPEGGRGTLCVSSQAGCILDCSFCATGKQGFDSNLTAAEIIGQVWLARRELGSFENGGGPPVTNVVFMGMGEPLLNFDNVMDAVDLMLDDHAYGLSKRRVTISTAGVIPGLERMRGRTDVALAISLHAANDELRDELVPLNRKYPIAMLLEATSAYIADLGEHRVPLIEYTLIRGINDHRRHARELAALLADFPCKINLIPFNEFSEVSYRRPSASSIGKFRKILQDAGHLVTVRTTRADEIAAACGQLTGSVHDQTRRRERFLRRLDGEASLIERPAGLIHSARDDSRQQAESQGTG